MEIKYKQAEEAVWATCGGCAAGQPRGRRSRMGAMLFAVLSRGGQATLACRNGAMQDHTRPRAATKPEEPFRLPGKFTVG